MNRNPSKLYVSIVRLALIAVLVSGTLAALPAAPALAAAPDAPQAGTACVLIQPAATTGKDAYIQQERPDEIKGGDPELRVKNENGKLMRSLLQFDLSGVPSGVVVTSATLSLYVKDANGGAVTINAHQVTKAWNEPQVTWKARDKAAKVLWTNQGGDYNSAVVSSAAVDDTKNVWRTWNLTSLATTWLSTPASNLGVILEAPAGSPHGEKKFKSSDDGTAAQRPKLEVCYSSGVTVDPDNSGDGVPGLTRTYAHVVRVGNITSAVNLSAASSQGWTTRVLKDVNGNGVKDPEDTPITVTPAIGPNADYPILAQVDIPSSASSGASDVTTVTATAQSNGSSDTAKDTTRIGKQIDVQPDNSSYATAGSVLFYGHQIINNGDAQDCMTVSTTSSQGWQVLLWQDLNANGVHETSNPNEPALSNPVCLNAGGTYHLVAEVRVPAGATVGAVDQTVITASSGSTPGKTGQAVDTTQVFVNDPPVIDGKYDTVYELSPNASQVCYNSNGTLFGKLSTFYQPTADAVYMVLAIDKDFVDNTYGANAIGWSSGHTFDNLLGSDHAQFQGYDANGTQVLDFKLDYIATQTGTSSGYKSCGVYTGLPYCTGKSDGKMTVGSASNILAWGTSFEYSLNYPGHCSGGNCAVLGTDLKVNSPATNAFYTPNPTYPNWLYDVIYEVKIAKAAFGAAGFGSLEVPYIHASPSKIGTNTIYATPGPCPGEIGDTAWKDLNANGVQDAGEPGIDGVQVKLYRDNGNGVFNAATDTLVGTQTTSAGGHYLFQNLVANDYFVDVMDATVPAGYQTTTYNDPTPIINLGEGQSYLQADFGYVIGVAAIGLVKYVSVDDRATWDDANTPPGPSVDKDKPVYFRFVITNVGTAPLSAVTLSDSDFNLSGCPAIPNPLLPGNQYSCTYGPVPAIAGLHENTATAIGHYNTASLVDTDMAHYTGAPVYAAIGDRVWNDANFNGIQDPGEPGIPGVQVELFDVDGNLTGTTTTDTNGIYGFNNLTPGDYLIQFGLPDGYVFTEQHQGGDPAQDSDANAVGSTDVFSLAAGDNDLTRDAGLAQVASLGDFVWLDLNMNGIQDAGESGVPGVDVNVNLYDSSGNLIDPTTTDANGQYLFNGLIPGDYMLQFERPAGAAFTLPNQGSNPAVDSDANVTTGQTGVFTLSPGENDLTWDAGLVPSGAIGDFVWYDANGDGVENVGEPGIPNVTIDLYRVTYTPVGVLEELVASTVTDADGGYLFPNLGPGTYTVDITDLNNALAGLTHIVANQSMPEPATVTLGMGEVNKDIDFGYVRLPSPGSAIIGDTVWYDANADGIQQPGEPGIPGVQVCATPKAGGAAVCATTDSNGHYLVQVPAGSYNVAPTNPPLGYSATTPALQAVTVAAGDQYLDADFGYDSPALGAIGNLVFLDNNTPAGNGIFDAGDTPLSGVSVDLIRDTNGNKAWDAGEPIIATVTTGSVLVANNGNYLFSAVPAGNYLVHVSDTNAVLTDYSQSQLGTAGADNNNQADPYPVGLPAGGANLTADFGYETGGGTGGGGPEGVIGNQVWIETDGNGLFDPVNGDFGQPGVTIELFKDGQPYSSTTTGASGRYAFLRLPAGNYTVSVSDMASVLLSYHETKLGPNPGQDNNNQAQPYAVVLPNGAYNPTADFGYTRPGGIGDYVWYDANGDGIQNVFEPGIGNVTLKLHRDNGDNVFNPASDTAVGIETTGADGGYFFNDLGPGVYFVDVTDSNGVLGGLIHTTGPESQPDPAGPIALQVGQVYRDADFGYVKTPISGKAIIGDTVWYDGNGDGVRNPGEPGISGVQVCATPISGGTAICDTTDSNGQYLIEAPAGTYNVAPTNPPAGATATTPVPHGPVTVSPGDQYLDADFGYISPNPGSISGTTWNDTSGDGLLDAGEPRIPGVSVDLIRDLNGDGFRNPGEPVVATVTSDQNGNYTFSGLPAGDYLVIVSDTQNVLADYSPTVPGPDPGLDNNNQELPYAIALAAGENDPTADFGYVQTGTHGKMGVIGNQVWYEADGNGIYNPESGDLGIAGVTVALYREGVPYGTTTTGAGGDYVFTSLPSGAYTVIVTDSAGVLQSYIGTVLGPNPGQDNHNQKQPYAIGLPAEGMNMTADFGYTRPGAIGDFIWYDTNRDGVQNVGEPGIPNITLDLYRGGVKIASTTTDADGGYLFPSLAPGSYVVDVTDLNNKLTGMTHIVANQSQPDPTAPISLGAGEVNKDADFGYVRVPNVGKAIIGDTVWYDANGDGIQQPGEPGIPGVQVCATPTNGAAASCGSTNDNGLYRIEVPAGSYQVAPTNPPGSYSATTPVPHLVTVVAGQQYLDADFGYDSPNLGRIGNLVFLDKDRDGVFNNNDTALAGVSVDLIRDTDGDKVWDAGEAIIATVTTGGTLDADGGNYLFPGVPGSAYLVHVSDTNAVLTDYNKSKLGTTGADNHNQADPYAINLVSGGSNLTADFGYYQTTRPHVGVIGNQIWIETANNGVFDTAQGDTGRPGVTVQLYKDGEPYGVTTSGASGDYSFIGLPAGTYTVTVTDDFIVLTGYAVTALGPNPGLDNNNQAQPYTAALPTAGYNLTADFGYILPKSSIGDTVFYDDNRSGAQDANEVGIPGIVVKLYTDGASACDTLVATTTTNTNGKYLFANLAAGHYCVIVPQTGSENPFLNNFQLSAGTNPHSVNLAVDQNYLDADFGFAGRGTIRGLVYYDWNQNGAQDLGESVIPNTQVCLFVDANSDGQKDSTLPFACTTTDAQGFYNFYNLLPGTYLMEQTLPGGLVNTTPLVIPAQLVLNQGTGISDNNNFGDLLNVRLGDFVWIDTDSDGIQDPGETTGLNGVPIRIIGVDIINRPVDTTLYTTDGGYLKGDLIPGTYIASAPPVFNSYARTSPESRTTTLTTSFVEDLTLDFGYAYPTGLEVQQFGAFSENSQVLLTWAIQGYAPDGFNVWRADNSKGLNAVNVTAKPVQTADGVNFKYLDTDVTAGQPYWYWLENPADGQRYGPVEVTAQAEPAARKRTYVPVIIR